MYVRLCIRDYAIYNFFFRSIAWVFIVAGIYGITSFYAIPLLQYVDSLLRKYNIVNNRFIASYEIKDLCSVCNSNSCKRHKLLPHSTKVKVPKDFDHALEQVIIIIIALLMHTIVIRLVHNLLQISLYCFAFLYNILENIYNLVIASGGDTANLCPRMVL